MYIKELELRNFKSFHKPVSIPFHNDFAVISGPNGSGKSNVVDAIVFALGLSTSRTMRAERLTDLIYDGSNGSKPDQAEVTIRLDNSDRVLPIDDDEIVITRKIKQTEKTYYSPYYLNGKPSSMGEIHRYLGKACISPETYNVIMQGDVTRIIEMSSTERRKLIDEIAGVAEFDARTEQAIEELETVRRRIEMTEILLSELEVRIEQLREERDHALKYQEMRDEKKQHESLILVSKLQSLEKQIAEKDAEIEKINSKKDAIAAELSSKGEQLAALEEELKEINQEITEKGEEEIIQLKKEIEEIKGSIDRARNSIELAKDEIGEIEGQRKRMMVDLDGARSTLEKVSGDINQEQIRKGSLTSEINEHQSRVEEINKQIREMGTEYEETNERLSELKDAIETIRDGKSELLRERDRHLDAVRRKSSETEEIREDVNGHQDQISNLELEKKRTDAGIQGVEDRINQTLDRIDDLESEKSKLKSDLEVAEKELHTAQEEYARSSAMVKAAQEMGRYSPAVNAILEAKKRHELPGIYGTIAELGSVGKKHSTALEVAAGARMQCLIVDNDADAARAMSYLKQCNAGRATFLPLNKLNVNPRYGGLNGQDGVVGYAIDLVKYDKKFDAAFRYVFGDTLVVEGLDGARKLMNEFRVVTLDGDLIEKSGAMTGGSKARSKFKFAAAEEDRLTKLAEEITVCESKRKSGIERMDAVEGEVTSLKRDIVDAEGLIRKHEMALEELDERIKRVKEMIEARESHLSEADSETEGIREKMLNLEKQIEEEDQLIAGKQKEIDKINRMLSDSKMKQLNEDMDEAKEEILHLRNRVRDIETILKKLNLEKDNASSMKAEMEKRMEEVDERITALQEKIDTHQKENTSMDEQLQEKLEREQDIGVEVSDLRDRRDAKLGEITQVEHERDELNHSHERLDGSIEHINSVKSELQVNAGEVRAEIERTGTQVDDETDVPSFESIKRNIIRLEAQMESMEPVNMLAITEFESVGNRRDDMQVKTDTLADERSQILQRIESYEQMKKDVFMETFDAININFQEVFMELSEGPGEMVLENSERPFDGGLTMSVQPRGKAAGRMEARSGGEKSLTALAFLFAIQRYKPSPFYALDEIDMFLDGVNSEKVAAMIKKLSDEAQFIVVSLRKSMIEASNRTIGVVIQEENVSSVTGVRLN